MTSSAPAHLAVTDRSGSAAAVVRSLRRRPVLLALTALYLVVACCTADLAGRLLAVGVITVHLTRLAWILRAELGHGAV